MDLEFQSRRSGRGRSGGKNADGTHSFEALQGINLKDDHYNYRWVGKVMPMDAQRPFGAPGDSGTVVYAVEWGIVVPLGIHLGTKGGYS
jgi:hypothetical protein